jgi:hypothetical protein
MREMLPPAVGFVCANYFDYLYAIANVGRIAPSNCRHWALEQFHYLKMARAYVKEYQREIEGEPGARVLSSMAQSVSIETLNVNGQLHKGRQAANSDVES